jgi:antirestriction protein ArdC
MGRFLVDLREVVDLPNCENIFRPAFNGPDEFAATALHVLAHWTGHPTRLNLDLQNRYGSAAYAMEELHAELASA